MDKWYRAKYKIQTNYDAEGRFDEGWRSLRRDLEKERKKEENDDDDVPVYKRQKLEDGEPRNIKSYLDRENQLGEQKFTRRPKHSAME